MTHSLFNLTILGCALTLSTGCAGTALLMKEGAGYSDLKHDQFVCREQVVRAPITIAYAVDQRGNVGTHHEVPRNMLECLAQKGWVRADG